MEDSGGAQDGDPSDSSSSKERLGLEIIDIVSDGDVLLDVTFETSKETLRAAKKAAAAAARPRPGQAQRNGVDDARPAMLKPKVRRGYRVHLDTLKRHSKYFNNLLGDTRFAEAKSILSAFERLSLRNVKPSEADPHDLPLVKIEEDDEATQSAGQETIFEDLLRILHGKDVITAPKSITMQYLAILAVMADRFDCVSPVSRYVNSGLKFKWPATQTRLSSAVRGTQEHSHPAALTKQGEETLRQKILVSWLLDQPLKMQAATRELIMYGSRKWASYAPDDEIEEDGDSAAWWDLPDNLEQELQYRRECVLNTIASIPRHFLQLYMSRGTRQCKLGYDSSSSCDSYQLGEMIKFLSNRKLLILVDFGTNSLDNLNTLGQFATVEIQHLVSLLKNCPSYQIDKNHTNCGLRTRILPVLEYMQAMMSSNAVAISRASWKKDRESTSWFPNAEGSLNGRVRQKEIFRFTRAMAGDQRFRYENMMATDRLARELFTAEEWNWTADESAGAEEEQQRFTPRLKF
ncbi:hypothetical protein QBC46DRAFT_374571 [Diplogelasinospora grovesii]|uniref:Hydroxyproline-rich glyco protein n=1 Tax=Diplogelasinospora grovesii TaxID=303347 RepID=A0AAN6NEX4_9PEZI|nr:hypothetical protein QBC46DRAFT_374571 [Diplogelasinospora grovesii]